MTTFAPIPRNLAKWRTNDEPTVLPPSQIEHVNEQFAKMVAPACELPEAPEASKPKREIDWTAVERWVLVGASVLSVGAVALIAGAISFGHMADWARINGEPSWRQPLFPLSVDGLVIAGSVVLLADSLAKRKRDWLAYLLVIVGALVSVSANVLHGWEHPIAGHVIAAWPPLSLIGSYELLMRLLRRIRRAHDETAGTPVAGTDPTGVPDSNEIAGSEAIAVAGSEAEPIATAVDRIPKAVRPPSLALTESDTALLAVLNDPHRVPRSKDGSVSIRAARKALGCGTDRARRLIAEAGLTRKSAA